MKINEYEGTVTHKWWALIRKTKAKCRSQVALKLDQDAKGVYTHDTNGANTVCPSKSRLQQMLCLKNILYWTKF